MKRSRCLIPLIALFLAGWVLGATVGPDLTRYMDMYQKLEEIQADVNDLDVLLPSPTVEPTASPEPVITPEPTLEVTPEPTALPTTEPTMVPTPEPTTSCGASVCPSGSPYGK